MRGWVIRIGILAVIVAIGSSSSDRLPGNAGDLQAGDCFDEPTQTQEVADVQHHPCTDAHDAEVIFVGDHPDSNVYPGIDAFDTFVLAQCVPAFETYTGRDWETDTELDLGYLYPTDRRLAERRS